MCSVGTKCVHGYKCGKSSIKFTLDKVIHKMARRCHLAGRSGRLNVISTCSPSLLLAHTRVYHSLAKEINTHNAEAGCIRFE